MSCRNKCFHPRQVVYEDKLSCYCDVHCEFFKDCCADYDDFCKTGDENNTAANNYTLRYQTTNADILNTSLPSNQTPPSNEELWNCFQQENIKPRTKGIWMIGSCPASWPKDDVLYQCRNLSVTNKITKENYRYLPVYTSNGRVYHNRFCAQCNGVHFNESLSYQFSYQCKFSPPQHVNISEIMENTSNCTRIGWKPAQGDPRRYCLRVKSKCTNTTMQGQCINGKVRIVNNNKCIYKNVHCARCNHDFSDIMCGPNISRLVDTCDDIVPRPTR
ncbi:hypothetical protein QZH41_000958 [Actinostola sp. cb2023]|nr:hypothetical protein QZH41_000958 [Actinostola sp. cb2023]